MRHIVITCEKLLLEAVLNDSSTAETVYDALPFEARANRWGDELYFEIPCDIPLEEDARDIVAPGELGYWPTGSAFCMFFGRTPASTDDRPRAASPVNVFGRITGDHASLRRIEDGTMIKVRRDEFVLGG